MARLPHTWRGGVVLIAWAIGCGGSPTPTAGPVPSSSTATADQAAPEADPDAPVTIGDATNCFVDASDASRYACFSAASPTGPVLALHRDAVFACVIAAAVIPPVTLIAQLTLRDDGGVAAMTVRGDEAIASCLSARAATWMFAPPEGGATGPSTTVIRLRAKE